MLMVAGTKIVLQSFYYVLNHIVMAHKLAQITTLLESTILLEVLLEEEDRPPALL